MEAFETFLKNHLPKFNCFYIDYERALAYSLQAGGKRFRPALIGAVCEGLQKPKDLGFEAALAVEMLHTYTLIHDDLPCMDDANLRRGMPSLHKVYGETLAVLAGDGLNTMAFEVLSFSSYDVMTKLALIQALSKYGSEVVLGQSIDCMLTHTEFNFEQMRFMHIKKTAVLIAACLKMGAIITKHEDLELPLFELGLDLGLLFQIQDDILDATKTAQELGKPVQADKKKNSFINVLGLKRSRQQCVVLARKIEKKLLNFQVPLQKSLNNLLSVYLNRHL